MTIKIASLKVDTKAESAGEWIDIKEWAGLVPDRPWEVTKLPGLKMKVRSVNDPAYKVARQKAAEDLEQKKKSYPDEVLPVEVTAAAEGKVIVENLLLDWQGFDIEYSKETASDLLCNPDGRNVREMAAFCATKVGRREVEFLEDSIKNSDGQPKAL